MNIKIYKMNDCDWVAAENEESAKECLATEFGEPSVYAYELNYDEVLEPKELSGEEMDRLIFKGETFGGKPLELTFRQALQNMLDNKEKFPVLFATTEY